MSFAFHATAWEGIVRFERDLEGGSSCNSVLPSPVQKKCIAHLSFDLDGNGVVSITDYKLAKDMDTDGSGHIDDEETCLGRTRLARNFYETKNQVTSRFHRRDWQEMEKAAKD